MDYHSPHGNPARTLGSSPQPGTQAWIDACSTRGVQYFKVEGAATTYAVESTQLVLRVVNPGHYSQYPYDPYGPAFPGGKWILVENPDVEIVGGTEVKDWDTGSYSGYPVNKLAIDWDVPFGRNAYADDISSQRYVKILNIAPGTPRPVLMIFISEFCADCHDGNAGLHTVQTKLFSEDRAARGDADPYDIGYGHDTQPRHCGRAMRFNPEDAGNPDDPNKGLFGPHCRNCHRGSSACGYCHGINGEEPTGAWVKDSPNPGLANRTTDPALAADNSASPGKSTYAPTEQWTRDRYVEWPIGWDTTEGTVAPQCADNGFYWPHRTMGYMMLKDELFGLDFDGTPVAVGETRNATDNWGEPWWRSAQWNGAPTTTVDTTPSFWGQPAQDLDSVCLDCHNPTIWNATAYNDYVDDPADPNDNYDDELLLRGLP